MNNRTLHEAAKKGDLERVLTLLESGADVNAVDEYGTTALHYSTGAGHIGVCQTLIDFGADVNTKVNYISRGAWTPLHWAAEEEQPECAILLLDRGARIDESDETGRTPLLGALDEMVAPKTAMVLMQRGADIYARDNFGTVFERAQRYDAYEIVKLWKELDVFRRSKF